MPIQWYPGHMHATRKAIAERVPEIDVVIEMLDARLPGSSSNPLLAELTRGKPSLKLLNKQDLADPDTTALWLAHFAQQPGTRAVGMDAGMAAPARALVAECRALAPLRGGMVKPLRVLICGIPNVGKSTLINTLTGQRTAKTGDEPGITKIEQRIALANDVTLFDTPGMMWPRLTVEMSGWHLAASGGIGRNAYDEQEVATNLLGSARVACAARLCSRYKLADIEPFTDDALLAEIGRRRGALMAGGRINLQKAAEIVINDFRAAAWGRVSLETPEQFSRWWAEGQVRDAEREARRRARQAGKAGKAAKPGRPDEAAADAPDAGADDGAAGPPGR